MTDAPTPLPEELSDVPEYGLSTEILNLIKSNISVLVKEYPNNSLASIVYTLTLSIIRSPQLRRTNGSMVPDILVYYLESYKQYRQAQEPDNVDPDIFLNEASLTLFDLYVEDPHNQTKRKLIELVAGSIREHWIDRVIADETIEGMDEFNIINNLTLLTNTLPFYTARPRRNKNITYVAWLKLILTKLCQEDNSRFLLSDESVLHVLAQISTRQKTILITKH